MSLDLLKAFQAVINDNGTAGGDVRVGMFVNPDNGSCSSRVVRLSNTDGNSNNAVREAFRIALTTAFEVKRLEELPPEVKRVLKIGDFKLSETGEATSTRPLTMRRIRAVMDAVKKVAVQSAPDVAERERIEASFASNFERPKAMEDALTRIAIASGRKPFTFRLPGGRNVDVTISNLTSYVKCFPMDPIAMNVENLHGMVQDDIEKGCAIYANLNNGIACKNSAESVRALKCYLSFVALVCGDGKGSKTVSVPDKSGLVADYIAKYDPDGIKCIKANETVKGSTNRILFVGCLECLGKTAEPMHQNDIDSRYQRLKSNPLSSGLLRRKAAQGGFTIAQMQANVKAELNRLAEVADDELALEVKAECGKCDMSTEAGRAAVGKTAAFDRFYSYRHELSEYILYLQLNRPDLPHPESRIADEIVLTDADIGRYAAGGAYNDSVVSPRGRRRDADPVRAALEPAQNFGPADRPAGWRQMLTAAFGGDQARALNSIVSCIRNGCLPPNGAQLPDIGVDRIRGMDVPPALAGYLDNADREWFADILWYVKCAAYVSDEYAMHGRPEKVPPPATEPPIWSALRKGIISRSLSEDVCREFRHLFQQDGPGEILERRVSYRNFVVPVGYDANDPVVRAAFTAWCFGTYDLERIIRYVNDCGFLLDQISTRDLRKLSVMAALCEYRLEEAPMFIQRQTGRTPDEVTEDDLIRLFRLKQTNQLNDRGMNLKGRPGEIVAVLKGDRLPSMTDANGEDIARMLSALRKLARAQPNSAQVVEFMGRKVSLHLTQAGTLVFGVDGLNFRAGKTAGEFVEMFEDDAIANVDRFGKHVVLSLLPQIRGSGLSPDVAERSRSRELCLRYLKGSLGIDPAVLASVSTRELFDIAEGVTDGRYCMRSGSVSDAAVKAMIDRTIRMDTVVSWDAAELCDEIENIVGADRVNMYDANPPSGRATGTSLTGDVKEVHEFLADLVFDANPFDYDRATREGLPPRVLGVMRRHVSAVVKIAKDPSLIATFPDVMVDNLGEMFGLLARPFLPASFIRNFPDAFLERVFLFLLDNAEKPKAERDAAVDAFIRANSPASQDVGFLGRAVGFVSGILLGDARQGRQAASDVALSMARDREMLVASLDEMAAALKGVEKAIDRGVSEAMDKVQGMLLGRLGAEGADGAQETEDPVWSKDFDEIVGGAMTSSEGGYGKFMRNVISTYFVNSAAIDQRQMMASFIRNVDGTSTVGAMAGALFKGAGPLLHKMLQGLPPGALGDDLAEALEDMKSNLLPIPEEYVKASMARIVERSDGRIHAVTVVRSLGAASVGQAFLCRMLTNEHPEGEECVVKLLRPTVKTTIARERKIFEAAAASVNGMAKTFAGQLARIMEELDFTLEATNINFGRSVYEQPTYLRQRSLMSGSEVESLVMTSLHSMEVHPLASPTMDCLVLKKAPGVTYDRYVRDTENTLAELVSGLEEENGRYVLGSVAEVTALRKRLTELYNETLKRQRFLVDLTKKWVHEGLFGNGFYHGDLHAGNIMTDGNGLTVIDFGNATHLTDLERGNVLRMISAALVGWSDMFESSFKALLSKEGLAEYDEANEDGAVSRDLAEVIHKGTRNDVGMRIAAALMLLQKHGIEVPGAIYNFNQCQMRLGGTVDSMEALLSRIYSEMTKLSVREMLYSTPEEGEYESSPLFAAVSFLIPSINHFLEFPFDAEYLPESNDWLVQNWLRINDTIRDAEGPFASFARELEQPEHCTEHVYPFIDQLLNVRYLSPDGAVGAPGNALTKEYRAYRAKETHTRAEMESLAQKVLAVIRELFNTVYMLQGETLNGRSESFLLAVGDGISDSLYTVRTTLGNITSVKMMREQSAEDLRLAQTQTRMEGIAGHVDGYMAAHPDTGLDANAVAAIRDAAARLSVPFDLPGLNGSRGWLKDEDSRRRMYEMLAVNVRRLLKDLEDSGVLDDGSTQETRKHAVRIAMQCLADRVGGLSDAFRDVEPRMRMRMMVELREQHPVVVGENADIAAFQKARMDNECVMTALLFMFGDEPPLNQEGGGQ